MDTDLTVNITLYNLEDVKFEGSKYVLTSPRSLEACSRLGVKPVELLYKPLSEFQEELLPQDVPLRTIYAVYDEGEEIRQKKLKLCREERSRIIEGERKNDIQSTLKSHLSTLPSEDSKSKQLRRGSNKSAVSFKTGIKGKPLYRSDDKENPKHHREHVPKRCRYPSHFGSSSAKGKAKKSEKWATQRCATSVTKGTKVPYRCASAPGGFVRLPERDAKILSLMKERRESEVHSLDSSNQAHQLWEDQRQRENALRTIMENKRRSLMIEEGRIKEAQRMKDKERKAKQDREEQEFLRAKLQESSLKTDMVLMNQIRMQELSLSDKLEKEMTKKRTQEQNLKTKEKDEENVKHHMLNKQKANLSSASIKRNMRIHNDYLQKFLDNRQEREQFEQRHNQIKSRNRQTQDEVQEAMDLRLSQAESNLNHLLETRNKHLEEQHQEKLARQERARSSHKKMEEEMNTWRSSLMQHKKQLEDRASHVASQGVEMKAQLARKRRVAKENKQKRNLTIFHHWLQRDVDKRKHQIQSSLSAKDRKVADLMKEKEKHLAQTRAMARLSETLRDDLREKYVSDTFDKKVLEAQLYANLCSDQRLKNQVHSKTRSSIKIC